jgi:hypothetical protein
MKGNERQLAHSPVAETPYELKYENVMSSWLRLVAAYRLAGTSARSSSVKGKRLERPYTELDDA